LTNEFNKGYTIFGMLALIINYAINCNVLRVHCSICKVITMEAAVVC